MGTCLNFSKLNKEALSPQQMLKRQPCFKGRGEREKKLPAYKYRYQSRLSNARLSHASVLRWDIIKIAMTI